MVNFAGTAYGYAKALQAQYKVNQKMDEMSGKKTSPFALSSVSIVAGIKVSVTDANNTSSINGIKIEEADYRLSQIVARLKSGKRLSSSELDYLRKKNAGLYRTALKIEREREEYEAELKRCRTKEDVHRAGMIRNQSLTAEVNKAAAKNDLSAAIEIEMRFNAIKDSRDTFINSEAFRRLPKNYKEIVDKMARRHRVSAPKMPEKELRDVPEFGETKTDKTEVVADDPENNSAANDKEPLPDTGEPDGLEVEPEIELPVFAHDYKKNEAKAAYGRRGRAGRR